METDHTDIKVIVPLREIEFLNFDDVSSDQERSFLYNCVKAHHEAPLPGSSKRPWQTPKREQDIELDFGSATAVFNSLQSGVSLDAGLGPPSHISLPPYMTGIPLPGSCPPQPQHIHINNFTANLNFPGGQHTVVSNPSQPSLPPQPMPFTVGYPSSGPYVAPFPQPSPSPPVYGAPIMVYQPPLHLSMYQPQPQQQPQPQLQPPQQQQAGASKEPKEQKETGASTPIMFGSTPVVSVKQTVSSSDEETEAARLGPATPQPTSPKSWASLFSPSPASTSQGADKPMARIPPFTPQPQQGAGQGSPEQREMAAYIQEYSLNHVAPSFLPRGLTNRSNWCFVNAILQALLACPPFYNLMKNLPTVTGLKSGKSSTPMIDSVVEFINEMSPLETMNKNQKKDKARKKEDLPTGNALEPSYVYKTLLQLESETFKVIEGRQEDAEEFLTCLLNMISDEMVSLLKLLEESGAEAAVKGSEEQSGGPEWQEVTGSRGKACITRRIKDQSNIVTPVQQLALGLCRYSVKSANNETSATLQPFFTLQLDIQSDNITSVNDALAENFSSEQLDGYICSKTKQEVEASRNLSLEELPPILILHLKRFVYNGTTGGCQKVMKQVDFSVDLEIGRDILSQPSKSKYTSKQRQYKLFAVVYHNGREATKGHYVTDVYHTGYASWLHCDDSIIQPTAEQLVTCPGPSSTPYILFYRRGDTMVGVEKTVK